MRREIVSSELRIEQWERHGLGEITIREGIKFTNCSKYTVEIYAMPKTPRGKMRLLHVLAPDMYVMFVENFAPGELLFRFV